MVIMETTITGEGKLNKDYKISFSDHRNWYFWNPQTEKFQDKTLYMYRGHDRAAFTRIPEDAALLRNCSLVT